MCAKVRDRISEPGSAIALTIAYDGAPFSGYACQPSLSTVEGTLEEALATVLRRSVRTTGAGRTDAGVHALGQVVSFNAEGDEPDVVTLRRSLDAVVGPHIAVRGVRRARAGFSARHDALSREYRYRVALGSALPLFTGHVAWRAKGALDIDAMVEGATALLGTHDFRSFCVVGSARDVSTVREIIELEMVREDVLGEELLTIRVVGNAFLHSMIRVIVGTLVEVGQGRQASSWVAEVLAARDRAEAGPTAPAHGLTLWHVEYPEDCWLDVPYPA